MNPSDEAASLQLIEAAAGSDLPGMKAALAAGADLRYTVDDDDALSECITADFEAGARLLIEHGAPLEVRNGGGHTALIRAVTFNRLQIVKLLLTAGADPNAQSPRGWPALLYAADGGLDACVEMLICHGADVNARSVSGTTAVSLATTYQRWPVVRQLIEAGAEACPPPALWMKDALDALKRDNDQSFLEAIYPGGRGFKVFAVEICARIAVCPTEFLDTYQRLGEDFAPHVEARRMREEGVPSQGHTSRRKVVGSL